MDNGISGSGAKGASPAEPQKNSESSSLSQKEDLKPQTGSGSSIPGKSLFSRVAQVKQELPDKSSLDMIFDEIISMKEQKSESGSLNDFRKKIDNRHFDVISDLLKNHDYVKALELLEASISLDLEGSFQLNLMREPMLVDISKGVRSRITDNADNQSMSMESLNKCMALLAVHKPSDATELEGIARKHGIQLGSVDKDENVASFNEVGRLFGANKYQEALTLLDQLVAQKHPSSHGLNLMRPTIEKKMASD